jgi:hypothetical protein
MKKVNQFTTNPSMAIPTRQSKPTSAQEPNIKKIALTALWQSINSRWIALFFLTCGVSIGLVYAWVINPVQYTGASYADLTPEDKGVLVQIASDLNAYDQNSPAVQQLRQKWPELDQLACFVVQNQPVAEDEKIRLVSLAYKINQKGCE